MYDVAPRFIFMTIDCFLNQWNFGSMQTYVVNYDKCKANKSIFVSKHYLLLENASVMEEVLQITHALVEMYTIDIFSLAA